MSIIYEALQKIQKNHQKKIDQQVKRTDWIDLVLIYTMVTLITLFVMYEYPFIKNTLISFSTPHKTPSHASSRSIQPVKKIDFEGIKAKFIVSGIFVSNEEKVALINNQFYHIGDQIEDMKIVSILSDRVNLKKDHKLLTLKIAL